MHARIIYSSVLFMFNPKRTCCYRSAAGTSHTRRVQRRVWHWKVGRLRLRLHWNARRPLRIFHAARTLLWPPSSGNRQVHRTRHVDCVQDGQLGGIHRVSSCLLFLRRQVTIKWHDRSWTISISNLSLLLTVISNSFISSCRYVQWNCSYKIS